MSARPKGFSLPEMLLALLIIGMLAAAALPDFGSNAAAERSRSRALATAQLLRFARTQAIRLNTPVIICGVLIRKDGRDSGVCKAAQISSALRAFADTNPDGNYKSEQDISLRVVHINGSQTDDSTLDIRMEALTTDGTRTLPEQLVFMPDGRFGYETADKTQKFSTAFIRIRFSHKRYPESATVFVIANPAGKTTLCRPDDDYPELPKACHAA